MRGDPMYAKRTIPTLRFGDPSKALKQAGVQQERIAPRCCGVLAAGSWLRTKWGARLRPCTLSLLSILLVSTAWAQTPDRITTRIDSSQSVALNGSVSPRVGSSVDEGPVDSLFKLSNIRMTFRQTPEQQAALEQLLASQQDPSSPNYHKWLTPEEFGDQFGLTES